jgi:hypothetical protein
VAQLCIRCFRLFISGVGARCKRHSCVLLAFVCSITANVFVEYYILKKNLRGNEEPIWGIGNRQLKEHHLVIPRTQEQCCTQLHCVIIIPHSSSQLILAVDASCDSDSCPQSRLRALSLPTVVSLATASFRGIPLCILLARVEHILLQFTEQHLIR